MIIPNDLMKGMTRHDPATPYSPPSHNSPREAMSAPP